MSTDVCGGRKLGRRNVTGLIPAPNVQTDLRTAGHRHTGMNRFSISFRFCIEVLPEDSTALLRLKSNTIICTITLDKVTPFLVLRLLESWKVGLQSIVSWVPSRHVVCKYTHSATCTFSAQIDHKRTYPPRSLATSRPVIVM